MIAYSFLYITVLSLGFLITSYVQWKGMPLDEISFFRGAGARTDFSALRESAPSSHCVQVATPIASRDDLPARFHLCRGGFGLHCYCYLPVSFPALWPRLDGCANSGENQHPPQRRAKFCLNPHDRPPISPVAGGLGLAYQFAWLLVGAGPGAACALVGRHCGSIRHLLVGLVISRTGVWTIDLALSQLIQEEVPVEELGTVSGVHNAICATTGLSMFVVGIILHRPEDFGYLMALSLLAVRLGRPDSARGTVFREGACR